MFVTGALVNDARGAPPTVATILPVACAYDCVTISPDETADDVVNVITDVVDPLTYVAVYVLDPSVTVIPAPDESVTGSFIAQVSVLPLIVAERTTGADGPDGVLIGGIVSMPAIDSSPVKSTFPTGAADRRKAGTKALPAGTFKKPSVAEKRAVACANATTCEDHSSKKTEPLYNPNWTTPATLDSNRRPLIRKPYGGGVRPYAASVLDEATRAASIAFWLSDVGLCGIFAVVSVSEKGRIT